MLSLPYKKLIVFFSLFLGTAFAGIFNAKAAIVYHSVNSHIDPPSTCGTSAFPYVIYIGGTGAAGEPTLVEPHPTTGNPVMYVDTAIVYYDDLSLNVSVNASLIGQGCPGVAQYNCVSIVGGIPKTASSGNVSANILAVELRDSSDATLAAVLVTPALSEQCTVGSSVTRPICALKWDGGECVNDCLALNSSIDPPIAQQECETFCQSCDPAVPNYCCSPYVCETSGLCQDPPGATQYPTCSTGVDCYTDCLNENTNPGDPIIQSECTAWCSSCNGTDNCCPGTTCDVGSGACVPDVLTSTGTEVVILGASRVDPPLSNTCGTGNFSYVIYVESLQPSIVDVRANVNSVDVSHITSLTTPTLIDPACPGVSGGNCITLRGEIPVTGSVPGATLNANVNGVILNLNKEVNGSSVYVVAADPVITNKCTIPTTSSTIYPSCALAYNSTCIDNCLAQNPSPPDATVISECDIWCLSCPDPGLDGNAPGSFCCPGTYCDAGGSGMCMVGTGHTPGVNCDPDDNDYSSGSCQNPECATDYCCGQGAASTITCIPNWQAIGGYNYDDFGDVDTFLTRTRKLLTFLGVIVGAIVILSCGYNYMTSEGDPYKIKNAKECLTAGLIGLLFILLATSVINTLINLVFF